MSDIADVRYWRGVDALWQDLCAQLTEDRETNFDSQRVAAETPRAKLAIRESPLAGQVGNAGESAQKVMSYRHQSRAGRAWSWQRPG